ncbi:hypothetical protein [Limnobaculum zhutongyuii]|uniref:hypothetical protein n=1 Tax=Limnobaculum zhutongyuii TaxID=2498113 RepID=UPI001159EF2E|nr:hypothetical protein [Limnobaculum zhutongyuii]
MSRQRSLRRAKGRWGERPSALPAPAQPTVDRRIAAATSANKKADAPAQSRSRRRCASTNIHVGRATFLLAEATFGCFNLKGKGQRAKGKGQRAKYKY